MPSRRPFITEYWEGGARYGAEVWATSWKEAEDFCRWRGLGEKVNGRGQMLPQVRASDALRSRLPFHEKLHAFCFFMFLATASDRAQVRELVGDTGILHEWVHWLTPAIRKQPQSETPTLGEIIRRVEKVERRIPGYPPRKKKTS